MTYAFSRLFKLHLPSCSSKR